MLTIKYPRPYYPCSGYTPETVRFLNNVQVTSYEREADKLRTPKHRYNFLRELRNISSVHLQRLDGEIPRAGIG